MADDDDFVALLADFEADEKLFEEEDLILIDNISANLRELAGLGEGGERFESDWQAPSAPGLDNSGLATDEARRHAEDDARRAKVAAGDAAMWAELSSESPQRRPSSLKSRPSGNMNIATSDNLLADLDADAQRYTQAMTKEQAAQVVDNFDALAAHARRDAKLESESLRALVVETASVSEAASGLLKICLTPKRFRNQNGGA